MEELFTADAREGPDLSVREMMERDNQCDRGFLFIPGVYNMEIPSPVMSGMYGYVVTDPPLAYKYFHAPGLCIRECLTAVVVSGIAGCLPGRMDKRGDDYVLAMPLNHGSVFREIMARDEPSRDWILPEMYKILRTIGNHGIVHKDCQVDNFMLSFPGAMILGDYTTTLLGVIAYIPSAPGYPQIFRRSDRYASTEEHTSTTGDDMYCMAMSYIHSTGGMPFQCKNTAELDIEIEARVYSTLCSLEIKDVWTNNVIANTLSTYDSEGLDVMCQDYSRGTLLSRIIDNVPSIYPKDSVPYAYGVDVVRDTDENLVDAIEYAIKLVPTAGRSLPQIITLQRFWYTNINTYHLSEDPTDALTCCMDIVSYVGVVAKRAILETVLVLARKMDVDPHIYTEIALCHLCRPTGNSIITDDMMRTINEKTNAMLLCTPMTFLFLIKDISEVSDSDWLVTATMLIMRISVVAMWEINPLTVATYVCVLTDRVMRGGDITTHQGGVLKEIDVNGALEHATRIPAITDRVE